MAQVPASPEASTGLFGWTSPPPIVIECDGFKGSLGMLFHLARLRRVNLLLVPIQPVCEAYLSYVLQNDEPDLDAAGAALVALAYLIERKAHALIPVDEVEAEDLEYGDRDALERSIEEYLPAIEALKDGWTAREARFFRSVEVEDGAYELPFELGDVKADDLARAFERLLRRATPDPIETLQRSRRSLTEHMNVVMATLTPEFRSLDDLVEGEFTRTDAVYWFLALLELIRLGQAQVRLDESEVAFARGTGN